MSAEHPLPQTLTLIDRGIADGLHTGAQLYVALGNEPPIDHASGESRPGVAMTTDTLLLWLSASKPLTAVAVLQQCERGSCELDEPVARHVPEFAASGKEAVTIRQLLTHTAGFRWIDIGDETTPWDEIVRRICRASLERDWAPGLRAGYHPYTSWYILGELVQRLDGRPLGQYVRQEICLPLGMTDTWMGLPADVQAALGTRVGPMFNTERGDGSVHTWSNAVGRGRCAPGGSTHGPAHDLGKFYRALRAGGTGVLSADWVAEMTRPQRVGMRDETFRHTIDWGLGVILDSKQYGLSWVPYGYGRYASPRTFGHSGSQSSVAFFDPAYDLIAVVIFNGTPGEARHQPRMRAVLEALYGDLGLAGP